MDFVLQGKRRPEIFRGDAFFSSVFFRYDRRFIRALSEIYPRFIGKFSARIADTSKKALSAHKRKPFSVLELFHHDFGLFKLF